MENDDENNIFDEDNSDLELQVAFEKGLLKPGLNIEVSNVKREKQHINNIQGLKNKYNEIKSNLSWDERLDLFCDPAPLDPELAVQLNIYNQKNDTKEKLDLATNDFHREMHFYRIAQSGVLEGISKLKKLGIATKRPDDYFAEMAKSDEHMQKVRSQLRKKENVINLKEKAKRMRELKKFGKKVQIEKQLERQKEKRLLMDQIKKFRKGKSNSLDFLDNDNVEAFDSSGIIKSKKQQKQEIQQAKNKRQMKDKKFGFGPERRKPGWKRNKAKDLDGPLNQVGKVKGRNKMSNKNKKISNRNKKRPGKSVRQQMKKRK